MRGALLAAALLLALGLLPGAGAAEATRMEGEARTRDAGVCTGGEPVSTWTVPEASGGIVLALMNDDCWAEWDVTFGTNMAAMAIGAFNNGQASECFRFDVHVDGVLAGATPSLCGSTLGTLEILDVLLGGEPVSISGAARTIRLTEKVTKGSSSMNAGIDLLEFVPVLPGCEAINRPPAPPGLPETDGLGNPRNYLWAGFPYTFRTTAAIDPDGDPLRYEWLWGDGTAEAGGTSAMHTYASDWGKKVRVQAIDDPSARSQTGCPPLQARSSDATRTFFVHPDFTYGWVHPFPEDTCIAGQRTKTGVQAIAGQCDLRVAIGPNPRHGDGATSVYSHTDFFLDGAFYARSSGDPWRGTAAYDSLEHPRLTPMSLHACIKARNDIYDRTFCGPSFDFVNV